MVRMTALANRLHAVRVARHGRSDEVALRKWFVSGLPFPHRGRALVG